MSAYFIKKPVNDEHNVKLDPFLHNKEWGGNGMMTTRQTHPLIIRLAPFGTPHSTATATQLRDGRCVAVE